MQHFAPYIPTSLSCSTLARIALLNCQLLAQNVMATKLYRALYHKDRITLADK